MQKVLGLSVNWLYCFPMKTTNKQRQPVAYLAPNSPARFSYLGGDYVSGDRPEAVEEMFTSATPGFVHLNMENGCKLTVETGKGYLLGVK